MASNGRHKHTAEPENSTTRVREVQSQNAFQLQIKALLFPKMLLILVDHEITMLVIKPDNHVNDSDP